MENHTSDHDLLIRLDEKVNIVLQALKTITDAQATHERRISSLERWRSYVFGVAAAAGVIGGMLFNWINTR